MEVNFEAKYFTSISPPPCFEKYCRLIPQYCNMPLWLVSSMEVCSAGSSCCLFGSVIKAVKHECVWPPTNEILPTRGGHDDILWVEVCSQAALTLLTYLKWELQKIFRYSCKIHVSVCFVDELKEKLQDFVSETNSQRPGFIKLVRHDKQEGLIRSRVSGWRAATAPVVALFDAHVEFNVGWWVTHNMCGMRLAQLNTRVLLLESYNSVWA